MRSNQNTSKLLVSGMVLCLLGSVGCASKGFVQSELDAMKAELRSEFDADLADVQNSTDEAMARAELAAAYAGEARDLALGKVGFHEVDSYTVYFDFDSHELTDGAKAILDQASVRIRTHTDYLVDIYGFTDAVGNADYNLALGQKRAESVMRHLVSEHPGQMSRFVALSFGEEDRYGLEGETEDRRRVEVSLVTRLAPEDGAALTEYEVQGGK